MGTSGGVRPMFFQSCADMVALAGTPTAVTTNDFPQWELDDGDAVCGTMIIPHGFGLAEGHVVGYDPAANAGTYDLRLRIRALAFLEAVTTAYDLDQTISVSSHPQNIPLPVVYNDLAVAGTTWTWRLDRTATGFADTFRLMGINWEVTG